MTQENAGIRIKLDVAWEDRNHCDSEHGAGAITPAISGVCVRVQLRGTCLAHSQVRFEPQHFQE